MKKTKTIIILVIISILSLLGNCFQCNNKKEFNFIIKQKQKTNDSLTLEVKNGKKFAHNVCRENDTLLYENLQLKYDYDSLTYIYCDNRDSSNRYYSALLFSKKLNQIDYLDSLLQNAQKELLNICKH